MRQDYITIILCVIHLLIITIYLFIRRDTLLRPIVFLSAAQFLTFVFRPLLLLIDISYGAYWPIFQYDHEGFIWAEIMGLTATIFLYVGFDLIRHRSLPFDITIIETPSQLYKISLLLMGLFLAFIALRSRLDRIAVDTTRIGELLSGRYRGEIGAGSVGYGYETFAWNMASLYPGVAAAGFLSMRRPNYVLFALIFVLSIIVSAPIGGRQLFLVQFMLVVTVWHYRVSRISSIQQIVAMLGGLSIVTFIGWLRSDQESGTVSSTDTLIYPTASFDGFECLVVMYNKFNFGDIVYGRTYFESIFYTFIPRIIWKSKPIIFGALDAEMYVFPSIAEANGNIGTFPIGFVGEALYNFWYLGIIIVPIAMGALFGFVERITIDARSSCVPVLLCGSLMGATIEYARSFGDSLLSFLFLTCLFSVFFLPRVRIVWH